MDGYALITGAASGMGRIYARLLRERGYGLVLVDINSSGLATLADELGGDGPDIIIIDQNLASDGAVEAIASAVSGIDIEVIVNNAGFVFTTEIADTPKEKLQAMMMVHCVTPLLLCREFVPAMKERGCGYILNISSICAKMNWPAIGMYAGTKAFVRNYSRSLRIECRGSGVSVTTAMFGAVDTPLFGFSAKTRKWMHATGLMISPEKAAGKALDGLFKRRRKVIPGFINRLSLVFAPMISDRQLSRLYRKYRHLLERAGQ